MTSYHVRQAIVTKYIGPTNFRAGRVRAKAAAGSITIEWDHALNIEQNHAKAAEALARKFKWSGFWVQGGMPDDSGYCFIGETVNHERQESRWAFHVSELIHRAA